MESCELESSSLGVDRSIAVGIRLSSVDFQFYRDPLHIFAPSVQRDVHNLAGGCCLLEPCSTITEAIDGIENKTRPT